MNCFVAWRRLGCWCQNKLGRPAIRHLAEATFKHPSGSWKLLLFTSLDVKVAIAAFRRLLGRDVEIDPALERI